ncbi:hypothetical protein EAI_03122 [Harpegnathos saltator]|uniref:Uncharacterized protein n=1 Tax=Harpegnathos saltator TaxID=610380 RepID=E2B714_HARSA|nr:hypothetical protein EAI_03122 [Harpegnathos saltator]
MDLSQLEVSKTEKENVCLTGNPDTSNCVSFFKLGDTSQFITNNDGSDGEAETMSFVVLGKDSLDAIQASSLASYVDIQQKSMSVDYNSLISVLPINETHKKLTELLQENTKLKETLKQNSLAMKKQLSTMASWQGIVMKLHENHKKKFKETTDLINNLKRENLELKTRLATQQSEDTEHNFEAINRTNSDNDDTVIYTSQWDIDDITSKTEALKFQSDEASESFKEEKHASLDNQKSQLLQQTDFMEGHLEV